MLAYWQPWRGGLIACRIVGRMTIQGVDYCRIVITARKASTRGFDCPAGAVHVVPWSQLWARPVHKSRQHLGRFYGVGPDISAIPFVKD